MNTPFTLKEFVIAILILSVCYYFIFRWMRKAAREQDRKEQDRYPSATRKYTDKVNEKMSMDYDNEFWPDRSIN